MAVSRRSSIFLVLCTLLLISAGTNFSIQSLQTSPSPAATPSPSPSVTPIALKAPSQSPTPLPGARNFHQWGSITLFNGLPSDSVRAIAQTPDGVMWFGTDNGIARFDGRRIQNFSLGASDANMVSVLKSTSAGQLWIGTRAGAFVYDANGFQPVSGTDGVGISAILLTTETILGTDTGLVLRVTADDSGAVRAERMFREAILSNDGNTVAITSLIEHDGRVMAAASTRGLFMLHEGRVEPYSIRPNFLSINSLARSSAGRLWFGTYAAKGVSGIYSADNGSRAERVTAPTADVMVLEANESGLWAGTERFGLFHVAGSKLTKTYTFENTSGGLRSDNIFSLFTDREGVIWIGTNRGVSRFDLLGPYQQTVSDIPNSNFIRTLYQVPGKGGRFYAGSNRGLFYQGSDDNWIEVPALRNKVIYAVKQRGDASMIIGTPEGVFDLSGNRLFGGDVRSFASFNRREYAAVFGRGVVEITGDGSRSVFNDVTVTSVHTSPDKLWIGTAGNGLFSYNGQTVKHEAGPDVLKSGTIWNMFHGSNGTLYIAGQHGVFMLREGGVEQIFAAEDVRDVVERDGHIWAATVTRGLLHSRHDERFGWLVSSIGFEQGLPSEKAFAILKASDELAIGTNRGVVIYGLRTIAPKLIATRILSQRTHDLNELGSTIELEYPQNSLLIEVGGQSSRTFAEEFQYSFLLRNSKGEVIDSRISNDPQFAPADLRPGEYSVESVAYDRDLAASDPLIVRFSIGRAPFPWTATALGVLLAVAIIALIWAMIERRRIVLRNRELAAARFDLANEAERERGRIARDLHDQTLADLRSLMIKSDRLAPAIPELRSEIESVSAEIRRICEDLSPSVLENVGLIAALEFLLSKTIAKYKFDAKDDLEEKIELPLKVKLQIYRIVQEILSNINRHSNAALVVMNVEVSDDGKFRITISDDGASFQPARSMANGRGISNIRSRANLINARIGWKENPQGGNVFSLTIGA